MLRDKVGLRKRVPERTCIGCGRVSPKRELVRIVRTAEGRVQVDLTGRQAGRGAYLCRAAHCWELALKRAALNRALRLEVGKDDQAGLQAAQLALVSDHPGMPESVVVARGDG